MTSPATFVHLHNHTVHSLLDSTAQVERMCEKAANDNQPAIAVTDHGDISGAWKFAQAARKAGIKPILGMEAYLSFGSRFEQNWIVVDAANDSDADGDGTDGNRKKKVYMHLSLLARNRAGWLNLVKMHNASYDSVWFKPRVDLDLLREHAEGLIVLTGCLGGPVAGPLYRGDVDEARENLRTLKDIVEDGSLFVEVMEHGVDGEAAVLKQLVALARDEGLPFVATNDCHYVDEADAVPHDAWLCTATRKKVTDADRFRFNGHGYWLKTSAEMRAIYPQAKSWQEACDNTLRVADLVDDDVLPEPKVRLPKFPLPAGESDENAYFKRLIGQGAQRVYVDELDDEGRLPGHIQERLREEFNIITSMGYAAYFLIVADIIEWARSDRGLPSPGHPDGEPGVKKPILVGPGRGSAAGSVVSYALGIVGVDPIRFDLLFERFLEAGREGMPDIDVDFEKERRSEVLDYLVARYGADRVAQIGTFGVVRSKQAVKDAARVLGVRPSMADRINSLIPTEEAKAVPLPQVLDPGFQGGRDLRDLVAADGDVARVVDLAQSFEGVIRTQSIHACGVLISAEPFEDLGIPLRWEWDSKNRRKKGLPITCWDAPDVGDEGGVGLLKMDVLVLRNLDIVAACVDNIAEMTGEVVDPDNLPDPDSVARGLVSADSVEGRRVKAAWDLLCAGKTSGLFQLDSSGITKLTTEVRPQVLDDLSSIMALYRPGPMGAGSHDNFVANRDNDTGGYVRYTTDEGEAAQIGSVLDVTESVLVYQEQLMRLGTVVAGFTPAQRSRLRKAVAKKKKDVLAAVGREWFEGATKRIECEDGFVSVPFQESTARKMWDDFQDCASYLFNKSHSVAYAKVGFVTAYLKANWPAAYAAAMLACTPRGDKRDLLLPQITADGVAVVPPSINASAPHTAPDPGAVDRVLVGLSEVKSVGKAAHAICAERDANGPFGSLADLVRRVRVPNGEGGTTGLSSGAVEALIEAGALDEWGPRLGLMVSWRALVGGGLCAVPDMEWGVLERAARQRGVLGVVAGEHPMESAAVRSTLAEFRVADIVDDHGELVGRPVTPLAEVQHGSGYSLIATAGVLSEWKEKATGRGRRAHFRVEGPEGSLAGIMWPDSLSRLRGRSGGLPSGSLVALVGSVKDSTRQFVTTNDAGDEVEQSEVKREVVADDMWVLDVGDDSGRVGLPVRKLTLVAAAGGGEPDPDPGSEPALDPDPDPRSEPVSESAVFEAVPAGGAVDAAGGKPVRVVVGLHDNPGVTSVFGADLRRVAPMDTSWHGWFKQAAGAGAPKAGARPRSGEEKPFDVRSWRSFYDTYRDEGRLEPGGVFAKTVDGHVLTLFVIMGDLSDYEPVHDADELSLGQVERWLAEAERIAAVKSGRRPVLRAVS